LSGAALDRADFFASGRLISLTDTRLTRRLPGSWLEPWLMGTRLDGKDG